MKSISTELARRTGDGWEPVGATLVIDVPIDVIEATELAWAVPRLEGARRLQAAGQTVPEHWHWDWKTNKAPKLQLLNYRSAGIDVEGEMQGLMMVSLASQLARLPPDKDKPLVYVDYVESAPWNVKGLADGPPRYGAVGTRLMEAAVQLSHEEGFAGRVGLHALPQANKFYEQTCGMTPVGLDPKCQNLCWYELTRKASQEFPGGQYNAT